MRSIATWSVLVLGTAAIGCFGDDDGSGGTAPQPAIADVDAPCSEYDSESNGSIDLVYRYTYDDDGLLAHYTAEPGMIVADLTYDARNFLVHFAFNQDSDAALEYEETWTRDSAGRVLTYEQRDDTSVYESATYTRDAQGRVLRSVISRQGSAGLVPATTDYIYTGDQLNPTSARLTYPDGATAVTYTSSSDQRMLHADLDDGEDGTVDRTTDTTYDGRRRVVSSISRTMGVVTSRQEATYNGRGSLVESVFSDDEAGLADDYVYTGTYNSAGMQTRAEVVSPTGDYSSSVYTEVYKSDCVAPTPRTTTKPRLLRPLSLDRALDVSAPAPL